MPLARVLAVWFVFIFVESVHGTLRVLFLEPAIGVTRAKQIAFFVGIGLIFAVTWLFIRWMNVRSVSGLIMTGLLWVSLTLCFEIWIGFLQGFGWDRIIADYDVTRGGLMLFGMAYLALSPLIAAKLRRLI